MDGIPGYEIVQALGSKRGFQRFEARGEDDQDAILSVLDRESWDTQGTVQLKRDLETWKRLSHPRLLELMAVGDEGERLWYSVRRLPGRSLRDHLEERFSDGGRFPISEVLSIARGLGEGLRYLHEQDVVHGDVDPGNVFLPATGEGPVLAGFYLGRPRSGESRPPPSLRYASPEQVQGDSMDARADVYQVGMLLYHMLAGKPPREDDNAFQTMLRRQQEPIPSPRREADQIPEGIDRMVMKCLQFSPEARYADGAAFLRDLGTLDPSTGAVLAGEATPGLAPEKKDDDPFAGLYIPTEGGKPRSKSGSGAAYMGVLAGVLAVLAFLAGLISFL